jgi:hypothetical protein
MDIAHSCGSTRVATASLSTFRPIASCTDRVAICQILHGFLLSGKWEIQNAPSPPVPWYEFSKGEEQAFASDLSGQQSVEPWTRNNLIIYLIKRFDHA